MWSFKKIKYKKQVLLLPVLALAAGFALWFYLWGKGAHVPEFEDVRDSFRKSDAVLIDRNGEVIHELRVDEKGRRLDWAKLDEISPALISAVLTSEDKRFYSHNGVDWIALVSAAARSPFSEKPRGASTITMQLASILNKRLQGHGYRRDLRQKIGQIRYAIGLERNWTKEEILEAYLNLATFRGELTGVRAASRGLFGKEPHGLNAKESIVLASLLRAPNASIDALTKRAYALEERLGTGSKPEEISFMIREALAHPHLVKPRESLAPHVAALLFKDKNRRNEITIRTTLDAGLQRFASETLKEHLLALKEQNVHDGAVVVIENATGEILAYVGSSGELSEAGQVDGLAAKRQAGSTLKPFLYALAIDRKIITPATLLDDSPLDIPVENGIYRPKNYDTRFRGLVSARTALASSLNVPTVKVLQLAGIENFLKALKGLGINGLERPGDFYGPSLALGSADVSLIELAGAYTALANEGARKPLKLTYDTSGGSFETKRVFSEEAAFIVSDILSDREARSSTFGLESPLSTRFWTAVKTGTSKDMRDNWCVGYSGRYTVGVWVGNFSGEPMWNVSGITGAAPIWTEVMNRLHEGIPENRRKSPSGAVSAKVDFSGTEPARTEWFIKGTESEYVTASGKPLEDLKIVYPVHGAIIAMDPDIPHGQEMVFFEAEKQTWEPVWVLDGNNLGSGRVIGWTPTAGRHTLSIIDPERKIIDSVNFEVRGENAGDE